MSNAFDDLDKILNVAENAVIEREKPPKIEPRKSDDELDTDYQYARENFYNVIEKGTHALEDMIEVARASEHPRAYEVVSTIMKTLVDANKDLVQMSDKKVEREAKVEKPGTVNNNLFVGSTADLQKVLKDLKNEK